MGDDDTRYTLIWLWSGVGTIISKRLYEKWEVIAAEHGRDYLSSMTKSLDEILEYVRGDYELDEGEMQRVRESLEAFEQSDELVIEAPWLTMSND
jgi:hypothetical protein